MTSAADHWRKAEERLKYAYDLYWDEVADRDVVELHLTAAQVHATLAQAGAVMLAGSAHSRERSELIAVITEKEGG